MSGQPAYSDQSVIYRPGYPNVGNNGTDAGDVAVTWPLISNSPYPDSNVASTLYRHGNYDTKNAATVWDAENADHSIPLHSSKPSYFGNLSWPAFNPSNPTAASVDDIPAGYQYLNGQDPPAGAGDSIGTLNVRNRMIVSP
jgi:hypothetical protein